ncbi:hypothetical protein CEXT_757841 [Caerostris extrusa]|uniref:Uncharacterized protein n=1 Tax=Caerostris extrusa TaxID=172846 RepID=A0AAV4P3C1_CAEEX|nr:hypothetical protein CEXT_757841 [Caerostris extrusa]
MIETTNMNREERGVRIGHCNNRLLPVLFALGIRMSPSSAAENYVIVFMPSIMLCGSVIRLCLFKSLRLCRWRELPIPIIILSAPRRKMERP